MLKFIQKNKLLIVILLLGLFFRIYKYEEYFLYSHDQDLASWIIKDVVFNKHLRLIGQETSNHGVFIGPLFYYALIPFYFLAGWDPIGGIWLSVLISALSIVSIYYVFTKIFNKQVGLIASFVYAFSLLVIFTDREVVPTTPVMLWSVWLLYALHLILKGKQRAGFLLSAILLSLIWHFNLALLLLIPLLPLSFGLSRKRLDFKSLGLSLALLMILLLPFWLFEIKHDFQQIQSIITSVSTDSGYVPETAKGLDKWDRTMQLVYKNTTSLFYGPFLEDYKKVTFFVLLTSIFYLVYKKILKRAWAVLFISWIMLFITFFSVNSINLSEYYLNGKNIVWIAIFSLIIYSLLKSKHKKAFGALLLGTFALANIHRFFNYPVNQSGYIHRKQIVNYIKQDAITHGYPCISVSYITTPGNNFGYRYLFFIEKMHVNQPKSGSPVYSIVYPHSMVDKMDQTFGALGLVLPDYERYNSDSVAVTCSGENANITDPMFGYTQ